VGVQEIERDKGDRVRAGDYFFVYGKERKNYQVGMGFCTHRIGTAV
jgi:hypothetical protein